MANRVMATFRPQERDIAIFIDSKVRISMTTLSLEEARHIHATLGQALRIAASVEDPAAAVGASA